MYNCDDLMGLKFFVDSAIKCQFKRRTDLKGISITAECTRKTIYERHIYVILKDTFLPC